jgi:hypothetical protein
MNLILLCFSLATAIIDQQTITLNPDDVYTNYLRFSFIEGGEVETNFDIKTKYNTDLGFYLCSSSQIKDLKRTFEDSDFCKNYDSAVFRGCDYHARVPAVVDELSYLANKTNFTFDMYMHQKAIDPAYLNDTELLVYEEQYINYTSSITTTGLDYVDVEVNRTTTYFFVLTNCAEVKVVVDVDYTVMNPNGEHLSVGYLELKEVMMVAKLAWGSVFFLWALTWIHSKLRRPKLVQVSLFLDAAIWTAYAFVEHEYWLSYSSEGYPDKQLECISFGLLTLAEALFFSSMAMLTSGVGIIHKCHFRIMVPACLCFLLVLSARIIQHYFGEKVLYGFAGLYMVFLFYLLNSICSTCRKLNRQLALISGIGLDPVGTEVWLRLRMFRILKVTLTILIPLLSASYIFTINFLVFLPWIAACGHISLVILTYFVLFLYVRFKRIDAYFDRVVFRVSPDIPEFTLQDIKRGCLPREFCDPFAVRPRQSYAPDKIVQIVPKPVVIKLNLPNPKLFLGFNLYSECQTFDADGPMPERAKLYESQSDEL